MRVDAIPTVVCGIDWSGAVDAGRRIWIAQGSHTAGQFVVSALDRALNLPEASRARGDCLAAIRRWIRGLGPSAIGCDFPFGLPARLMGGKAWNDFILEFADRFTTPESFAAWCRHTAAGKELKRSTDLIAKTPFSAYNLRMFRQTYWGMAGLLAPLVRTRSVAVLPMQAPKRKLPWLLETCPACVLKRLDLYRPYKGEQTNHRRQRDQIMGSLCEAGLVRVPDRIQAVAVDDVGGDALDAMIAGVATVRAITHPDFPIIEWRNEYAVEACAY